MWVPAIPAARAELRPVTRNAVVFIDSKVEGEEWKAYRLADARQPAVFAVEGPGRVLLELRTLANKDAPPAVAAVLLGERVVLTARVEALVDKDARIADAAIPSPPSKLSLYLVKVGEGSHRLTVRYSEGGLLLVAARFAPAVEEDWSASPDDLPLVAPRAESGPDVQRIGKLQAGPSALRAEPAAPVVKAAPEPPVEAEAVEEPEAPEAPEGEAPLEVAALEPGPTSFFETTLLAPRAVEVVVPRPLSVRAPIFQLEAKAGVRFGRLLPEVTPAAGLDLRAPVPGLDARRFSLGLSAELGVGVGRAAARDAGSGAAFELAEVRHTAATVGADLRVTLLEDPELWDPYAGLGGGVLVGRHASTIGAAERGGDLFGGFGALHLGAALGGAGSRPFAEVRLAAGALGGDAFSDPLTWASFSLLVGYRFELSAEVAGE